jgi:hypothetical protein
VHATGNTFIVDTSGDPVLPKRKACGSGVNERNELDQWCRSTTRPACQSRWGYCDDAAGGREWGQVCFSRPRQLRQACMSSPLALENFPTRSPADSNDRNARDARMNKLRYFL